MNTTPQSNLGKLAAKGLSKAAGMTLSYLAARAQKGAQQPHAGALAPWPVHPAGPAPAPPHGGGGGASNDVPLSPFDSFESTVLHTPMDTANCGEYAFSLYNTQLIVSMLGTGGGVGGEYDVSRLPVRTWTELMGRDGTPLPVLVRRDHGSVSVQVGNGAVTPGPSAIPTR